jgi:hypothetical protein
MSPGVKNTFEIAGDLDIHTGGKGTAVPVRQRRKHLH